MSERLSLRSRLIGTAVIGLAAFGCREKDAKVVGPQQTVAPTVSERLVTPAETQVSPTVVTTRAATAVVERIPVPAQPTTQATQRPEVPTAASNSAARFGEGFRNWVEVGDSESLRGLSEFTILARVKLDGIPPDAIVAKGDKVEAYAFFASILSCIDRSMSLVVDNENVCSGLVIPRDRFVNAAATFKDGRAKFYLESLESNQIMLNRKVPIENGPLFIGASPRGLLNQGMSGQIDYLAIVGRHLSSQEVGDGFALLRSKDIGALLSKYDTRGSWFFDGDHKDTSGKGNDGKPVGAVSLVVVN